MTVAHTDKQLPDQENITLHLGVRGKVIQNILS
jgi:hypothetical protein